MPTVVYGYFAVKFVSPYVQDLWPFGPRPGVFNALSAGLVMGIMILPTVVSLSEDALAAVPLDLRQGAYALGSTGYEVATKVTVPGRAVGHRRVVRARRVAGGRRDDDRADRGRRHAEPHA